MPKNSDSYIFQLIRKQVLPMATVIVASRPAAAANFRKIASKQIEVIGFLREQIYDYVKKYNFSNVSREDELRKYFDQHPNVLHSCYLPIHSAMVCFLFDELGTALPQTETEIYKEFTKYTILRLLYRCKDTYEDYIIESIQDLDQPQKGLYAKICKLAYEMTVSSKQVMEQAKLQSLLFEKEEKDFLGLVTVDRIATRLGFQRMYTFLHLTSQEFLAACYISNLEEIEQLEFIKKYGKEKQMQQVWKFYCGLVRFDGEHKLKFEAVIGHTECYGNLYMVQCCFEAQEPHLCDSVVMKNALSFTDSYLSSSNFTEIACIISNTRQNPVEQLSFEGCKFCEEGVATFVNKAGDKLSLITTLCYYKCDISQLQMLNCLVHALPSLKMLDISNSHVDRKEIGVFFVNGCLDHSSLETLIFDSQGYTLYSLVESQLILANECSSNLYHIFPGVARFLAEQSWPVKALSRQFILYPEKYEEIRQLCIVDGIKPPSIVLTKCHNLLTLDLSSNGMSKDSIIVVAGSLKDFTKLVKVDVSSNYLCYEGAETIAEGLKCCPFLLELNISSNYIGSSGAKAIAEALNHCFAIQELNISSNNIKCEGIKALSIFMMHWTKFCSLDISSNCIQSEGAMVLADALDRIPCFHELYIANNNIRDDGIQRLTSVLKNCTSIDISSNNIGNTNLAVFTGILKKLNISDNGPVGDGQDGHMPCSELARVIENNSCLQKLDISNNSLSNDDRDVLSSTIKLCVHLQELNISNTNYYTRDIFAVFYDLKYLTDLFIGFNPIDAKLLASGLMHCPSLCKLHINNSSIGDDGAQAVADIIKCCRKLCVLNVASNNIGSKGAKMLADALIESRNLSEFNISGNNITMTGEEALSLALEHCSSIRDLNFSSIFSIGLLYLSKSLRSYSNLTRLNISYNEFNVSEALAEGLKNCERLEELYIRCNLINHSGVRILADMLCKHCKRLRILDISDTCMGTSGINALGTVLVQCVNLQRLNVCKNSTDLDIENIVTFSKSLQHCSNLRVLDISSNNLKYRGVKVLFEGLEHCRTLGHLNISANQFGLCGVLALALANVLKHCSVLQTLDLSGNPIGDEGAVALGTLLKNSSTLGKLRVKNCGIGTKGSTALAKALQHSSGQVYLGSTVK